MIIKYLKYMKLYKFIMVITFQMTILFMERKSANLRSFQQYKHYYVITS